MERSFPWRVLEDAAEPSTTPTIGQALPAPPAPPGLGPAADGGRSRNPRASVIGVVAAGIAAILAIGVVVGGSPAATLELPGGAGDGGGALTVGRMPGPGSTGPAGAGSASGSPATPAPLVIDVAGAVRRPGVYRLDPGSRVVDAVAAAGGYGPRVDAEAASRINLAAPLRDGEQVRIPSRDDAVPLSPAAAADTGGGGGSGGGTASSSGALVDINTASAAQLDTLPGVGPATAAKIIAAREEAPFASVEELRSRGVVGEATFGKIRELVTVGP